jgi:hypothetical protein
MWKLIDLKKGNFININRELFEISNKTCFLPAPISEELELTFELMKVGEKQPAPNYRLVYIENPERLRFEFLDKKSNTWKEHKIEKLGF